jgi:hypothetical protein
VAGAAISDEAALVRALRAGEEGAYEALVRAHAPRLLAVARRFLRDEGDAQDAYRGRGRAAGFELRPGDRATLVQRDLEYCLAEWQIERSASARPG